MWLFVAFLLVPLIEIGLFIQIGGLIGLWPTLGIVILTAILGTYLVRSQGIAALNNLRGSCNTISFGSVGVAASSGINAGIMVIAIKILISRTKPKVIAIRLSASHKIGNTFHFIFGFSTEGGNVFG